jgi:transposase
MVRRHETRLLRKAGKTQKEIRELTGVAERSIRRIEREAPAEGFDDRAEARRRKVGRPSKVAPFLRRIEELLEDEPWMQSLEVFRRLKEDGYSGGKSAIAEAVAKMRPPDRTAVARFEGMPGEFSQHDFGEVDVEFLDGTVKRIHFLASRLKWSRWTQVSLTPDQTAESLVRALVEHFEAMGGVPLLAVFDRPKTIAVEWDKKGRVTKWNQTFLNVMSDLMVVPELCWPYQPQQKGAVENLVGWVKKSFFRARRFVNEVDLAHQLHAWLAEVNNERPSRATRETPLSRMENVERAKLKPLRVTSATLVLRHPVQVRPDARVLFDGYSYSMPPNAIGQSATLYLGANTVRIVAGRWEARHPRLRGERRESVLPEHRAAIIEAVRGPRAKLYTKRQHIADLGGEAFVFVTELVHRRPQQWGLDIERIHEMLAVHGDEAVLGAISAANAAGVYGAEYVAHHLGDPRMNRLVPGSVVTQ